MLKPVKAKKVKNVIYCDDKRYICPFCGNDIDSNTQTHCKDQIVPEWSGCYCCDDKKCCEEVCTCNGQHGLTDDTYGYITYKPKRGNFL